MTTEHAETHGGSERPGHLSLLDGVHVLVVEDDDEVREALVAVLEDCGAEVIAAPGGAAALSTLRHVQPDVLLSDIAMPGMDGHRLIRRIRALDPARGGSIPAAALTAYADAADRARALLGGFQVYLPKPFDPTELVTLVAHLAGRSSKT